jgi:hypothetical protein
VGVGREVPEDMGMDRRGWIRGLERSEVRDRMVSDTEKR